MEPVKDPSHLLKVDRLRHYAERPNFRIAELEISKSQKVQRHYHNSVQDTFYVVEGQIRIFLRDAKEEVRLTRDEVYSESHDGPIWSPTRAKNQRFSWFSKRARATSFHLSDGYPNTTVPVAE